LKLFRADILKNLNIEQPHFAANAETGLKPLLAGYNIEEVPISWFNRSIDMGSSTFDVAKVSPGYFSVLMTMIRRGREKTRPATAAAVTGRG
jgi:dolichol-phosphate mannosyltransferase